MRKVILTLFVLLVFSQIKASDTLTVSNVFEFAPGDTFDYCHIDNYNYQHIDDTTYYRYVLIDRQVSIAGDSITDTWRTMYPDTSLHTQIYHGINKLIAVYKLEVYNGASWIVAIDTPAQWDSIRYWLTGNTIGLYETYNFTKGLGLTYIARFGSNNSVFHDSSTELIYYSKGIRHAGTPYYTRINIPENSAISIYPNPTSNLLHLSYSLITQSPPQLILTDILGQQVYSSPITQSETTHDISKLSKGICTWRIADNNAIIKTGKLIKE